MKGYTSKPYWMSASIPKRHDIAILRPPERAKGERFETPEDAFAYSARLEDTLKRARGTHDYIGFLNDCRSNYYVCGKPFCPLCARRFRRWLYAEASQVIDQQATTVRIINPFLETRDRGDLRMADPRRLKDALRQQLNRAGFDGAIAVGGLEVGLKEDRWTVHAHIAVVGAQPTSIGNLRNFYKGAEVKRPLVVQKLNEPVKQPPISSSSTPTIAPPRVGKPTH